jgi:hypothetical protein
MNTFCKDCAYVNNCPYNYKLSLCVYYKERKIAGKEKVRKKRNLHYHRKSGYGFWGKKENTDRLIELRKQRYTQKEIAEIMGSTKANVNVRVHQLLKSGEIEEIGTGNNYGGKSRKLKKQERVSKSSTKNERR